VGTSGWSYQHWQACFYTGVERKDWLNFYVRLGLAADAGEEWRIAVKICRSLPY
jgi:uncharacterized protein YecE (DUF72 family)